MEPHQKRLQDLEQHLCENLELQKKLEDSLRYEDNEKTKAKLNKEIQELKENITACQNELDTVTKQITEREALAREMPSVTFDELDIVTKFILGMPPASSQINFDLTNISLKIEKNHLSQGVHFLITMGMGKVREVHRFVEHNAILYPDFPEKLKAGFLAEYRRLRIAGFEGDALFDCLHKFSCCNSSDMKRAAAGLAVLSYLFERCEVFEL
ncbi:hypothetical protein [Floridanema aerugineum]|uniref:FRIGIDA-like protein n=1 Tax=Floridaenema aerugineum BLCC-F46 TaxID=3153654 RepID=A0ABV4XCM3_9CYAN